MTDVIDNGESILQEAHRLTHGSRNKDYGHPLDDYTRTAALVSALLAHKLKEPLTAEEAAMIQICVKMSRHVHSPKRDNMTDAAGYAWVAWACTEERERREKAAVPTGTEPLWCILNGDGGMPRVAPRVGCECVNCAKVRDTAALSI